MRSAQITGILAPRSAISVVMQQNLSSLGAKEFLEAFLISMGGYYPVLFTAMAIVFVAGMVLESLPVTIILAPILAPIAAGVGVDPIQFAVVFLVGASIGFITPPYGLNLYVASGVTGVPYFRICDTRPCISFRSFWFGFSWLCFPAFQKRFCRVVVFTVSSRPSLAEVPQRYDGRHVIGNDPHQPAFAPCP